MSNKNSNKDFFSLFVNDKIGFIKKIVPNDVFFPFSIYVYHAVHYVFPLSYSYDSNLLSIGSAGKNKKEAELKCLGEAVERYCGYYGRFWTKNVFSSYLNLKENAVNPADFALFSDKQYRSEQFKYKKITQKDKIKWIKGKNLISGKNTYIPSNFCFLSRTLSSHNFCYSTSTGLSCGKNYEDAAKRAIYEVIERDAFMIMWFNKLQFPVLDIKFKNDSWLKNVFDVIENSDYKIYVFLIDNYTGIPVCLSAVLNKHKKFPLVSFGAASDLNLDNAVEKAVTESFHCLNYSLNLSEKDKEKIKEIFVPKDFSEHALIYTDPEKYKNLSFLFDNVKYKKYEYGNKNFKDYDLKDVVGLLKQRGCDKIIIVDLTPEEFKKLGFHVVKAVIPGFIDLSLGDFILNNGRRIYEIPVKLGFTEKEEEELNTCYHPFP